MLFTPLQAVESPFAAAHFSVSAAFFAAHTLIPFVNVHKDSAVLFIPSQAVESSFAAAHFSVLASFFAAHSFSAVYVHYDSVVLFTPLQLSSSVFAGEHWALLAGSIAVHVLVPGVNVHNSSTELLIFKQEVEFAFPPLHVTSLAVSFPVHVFWVAAFHSQEPVHSPGDLIEEQESAVNEFIINEIKIIILKIAIIFFFHFFLFLSFILGSKIVL